MFLLPPPSIPPRPMIFRRGLSSTILARPLLAAGWRGLSVCLAAASRYWLATRLASCTACFWARSAAPRETFLPVGVCPRLLFWPLRFGAGLFVGLLGLLVGLIL